MSNDLISAKKICYKCGKEILDGQAYAAVATDFDSGSTYDLLTKNYKWETAHNLTAPSRVPVVCE